MTERDILLIHRYDSIINHNLLQVIFFRYLKTKTVDITYDAKAIAEMSKPSSLVWYMLET